MEPIQQKAREVGRLVAQSEEYQALKRANQLLGDDRDSVTALNRLNELQDSFTRLLRRGEEPPREEQQEYEGLVEQIQTRPAYQAVVAAQSNFDGLMSRINEEIARGIEAGEQSRIILPD